MRKHFCLIALLFTFPITSIGCNRNISTVEHDHVKDHDAAGEAGTVLERLINKSNMTAILSDKLVEALKKSDLEPVHDELHDIGKLLESLTELTKQSNLQSSQKAEIERIVKELFDHFEKVDASLHGGKEVKTEELAPKISAATGDLRTFVKSLK